MLYRRLLAAAALAAGSAAQVAQFASSGRHTLSVNVPSDTASSGQGPIYLQISAPSGTEWVSFGQGSRMSGAHMFIVYAADNNNVTVSPRLGTGHVEPRVNSDAQVSVLEGSGVTTEGTLVANIRCDTCLSWNGGSMDPTDSSSTWIYAHKSGDALLSTSTDADISQHDGEGGFTLDLTVGTGGSSTNPFVAASDDSSSSGASASGSQTAGSTAGATGTTSTTSTTASATRGVSDPLSSFDSSASSSTGTALGPDNKIRIAHAVIMSLVFVILFPLSALTIYLPYNEKVRHIHAPMQGVSLVLMIVGLGLGIELARQLDELSGYHQALGYVVVAWLAIFQPALGLSQHLHFRKKGTRSAMGHTHRWLGRFFILLGIVNGGLGFRQAGPVGKGHSPVWSVVVYGVLALISFVVYIVIACRSPGAPKGSVSNGLPGEKPRPTTRGYELHDR
ncbi:hypothetical protein A1O1_04372 [Capronia coronata CBS 617.96]|uniref:DOMON domain-containing protein n=1 Tax=Capronia coronata CBS 617.96 TaxID=1182541 RepID=W9YEF8_9EURO|nr:uncharacterized protein A1O1_04372 [Capronia coronata CBS 617.96]EXJ91262.1 hypothetical protein A1O1_04372 [Capronia coronata CBS 617.96]